MTRALGEFATNLSVDPITGIATYSKDVIFGSNARIASPGATSDSVANKGQVDAASLLLVKGLFSNLKLSCSGTSAIVNISVDEIVLQNPSNYKYYIARGVTQTVSTAVTGLGGLDTGVIATGTWYSVWLVSDGTNLSTLISTSATAPTLPSGASGYVYRVRIGWIKTDGTANKYPLYFQQIGKRFRWKIDSSTNNGNSLAFLFASGVQGSFATPTSLPVQIRGVHIPSTAVAAYIWVSKDVSTSSAALVGTTNAPYTGGGLGCLTQFSSATASIINVSIGELLLESDYLYYIGDSAGAKTICFGWEDNI